MSTDTVERTWILITLGIGIFFFGLWTLFLVFIALMAESGGKNSNPPLAVAVLFPLAEIVWSWIWIARHGQEYASSRWLILGNILLIIAVVGPPAIMLCLAFLAPPTQPRISDWIFFSPMAISIVCCHAARQLWSSPDREHVAKAYGE